MNFWTMQCNIGLDWLKGPALFGEATVRVVMGMLSMYRLIAVHQPFLVGAMVGKRLLASIQNGGSLIGAIKILDGFRLNMILFWIENLFKFGH